MALRGTRVAGSLFNHSAQPNVSFQLNLDSYTISYTTFRPIVEGEELCIFYGHQASFGPPGASASGDTATVNGAEGAGGAEARRRDEFEEREDGWGGLATVFEKVTTAVKEVVLSKEERRRRWEREIVPWERTGWDKVTDEIDPEDMPLTLSASHDLLPAPDIVLPHR